MSMLDSCFCVTWSAPIPHQLFEALMSQQDRSMLKNPAEQREAPSHCNPLCLRRWDRAVCLLPSQKLCPGERNRRGREGEMISGEKRDKWWEENTVRREEPCITFGLVAAKSHFASFPILLGCSEKAPTRKGFLLLKNPFIITVYCNILTISRISDNITLSRENPYEKSIKLKVYIRN